MEEASWIKDGKVFNDSIHGHILFHPLLVAIIDTPQFQRLRHIKQLGGGYFVYPGASHNRFEHSLGVGHLAWELASRLKVQQPKLKITKEDVLCVAIAGLCHDLGHGPFSHLFDGKFIPRSEAANNGNWEHEHASLDMFNHMYDSNNLQEVFEKYMHKGDKDQVKKINDDIRFILEQIGGPLDENNVPLTKEKIQKNREERNKLNGKDDEDSKAKLKLLRLYSGREEEKGFLYEIVSNKRNGIDVDKWDYFARDCHHLGIRNSFDHRRFMQFARVIKLDGELQICSRDKDEEFLYDMFSARNSLHKRAYKHKTTIVIEHMLTEALLLADKYLTFLGKDENGSPVMKPLSATIRDMDAYTRVTDSVYYRILDSDNQILNPEALTPEQIKIVEDVKAARDVLKKIEKRELYKYVGKTKLIKPVTPKKDDDSSKQGSSGNANEESKPQSSRDKEQENIKQDPKDRIKQHIEEEFPDWKEKLVYEFCSYDFGSKDKDPIKSVGFYKKDNPGEAMYLHSEQIDRMIPRVFQETYLMVYSKNKDSVHKIATDFEKLCDKGPLRNLWLENYHFLKCGFKLFSNII